MKSAGENVLEYEAWPLHTWGNGMLLGCPAVCKHHANIYKLAAVRTRKMQSLMEMEQALAVENGSGSEPPVFVIRAVGPKEVVDNLYCSRDENRCK